jgi:hypothetical protein
MFHPAPCFCKVGIIEYQAFYPITLAGFFFSQPSVPDGK